MSTINLRTLSIGISILGLLACGSAKLGFAQAPGSTAAGAVGFTLTFDEQGNSLLNGNPNPGTLIAGGGVEYLLPQPVVPGDVLVVGLSDISVNNPLNISDLLSFFNIQTPTGQTGVLLYQSLIDDKDAVLDAADVTSFPLNATIFVTESGPEGNNGFQWIPDPANAAGAIYNGISDGLIPEPSTFILGGLGLIALALLGWRHHRGAGGLAKSR